MNLKRTVILFLVVSLSIVFAVCAFADSQNEGDEIPAPFYRCSALG